MTTPPELLEQALSAHSANLYRVALLLAGDDRRADRLLRATVRDLLDAPVAPLNELALITRLAAVARRREEADAERRERRPPRSRQMPALYQRVQGLPLAQRLSVGLHLLLGYDLELLAGVAATDAGSATRTLISAMHALAPAAGTSITDRVSGDLCDSVRAALIDPASRARHSGATRGHLAGCPACRSFDQAWGEVGQAVEGALRAVLRERALPAALEQQLLAMARPRRRLALRPELRFALPPLAVLGLVLALVLPGFMRPSVAIVARDAAAPPADPQDLVAQAITQHERPPSYGGPVWHARFETGWYFNDSTYAPINADLWLDRDNPARHRIQLTHRDGGAPYELQIGSGDDRLYYAIDTRYAEGLYGPLWTRTNDDLPLLLSEAIDRAGQERALQQRMLSGPWGIPPFYLRQAERAGDLRLLGRQRDGERTVQIVSFSGISPLGWPADAPGATADRVTVLLAIDSQDGRLRSATELAGPPGGAQTSRTTWRLVDEQWPVNADQIGAAFSIDRAWTGLGEFPLAPLHRSADLTMPAISAGELAMPARLLHPRELGLMLPAEPPPGTDRALLLWPRLDDITTRPRALVYLGADRRLAITYGSLRPASGEARTIGPWRATFQPGRGRHYQVSLEATSPSARAAATGGQAPDLMAIDAYGFSADEIAATIAGLRPFDTAALIRQDALFLHAGSHNPRARAALLGLIERATAPLDSQATYVRAERFSRNRIDTASRRDPYHSPPHDGLPEITTEETWFSAGPDPAIYSRSLDPLGAELRSGALSGSRGWIYSVRSRALQVWSTGRVRSLEWQPYEVQVAMDLLTYPDGGLELEEEGGGRQLITYSQPASEGLRYHATQMRGGDPRPYLFDLSPETITTEVHLNSAGSADMIFIYARGAQSNPRSPAQLVDAYTVQRREAVPLAEAPAALRGELPAADYTNDLSIPLGQSLSLRVLTLDEAVGRLDFPLYVLPADRALVRGVEDNIDDTPAPYIFDTLTNAVTTNLAVRVKMMVPSIEDGRDDELSILQGPAAPLRAYLAAQMDVPWQRSEPITLDLAGRPASAWLGSDADGQRYLIAEIDGVLLIVQADAAGFAERIIPLLSELRPAR